MAMMSMPWLFFVPVLIFISTVVASEGAEKLSRHSPLAFVQDREAQECNAVLATWSKAQVSEIVQSALSAQLDSNSTEAAVASFALLSAITYGVEVRRLCASCSDFPVEEQPEAYADFCTGYGSDTSFSGLLMIPLDENGTFLPGTHAGSIFCHGTSTDSVPSNSFQGENSLPEIVLFITVASTGAVSLMPDYMGYGESSGIIFKAYLVKQQYQTSIIPLWLMADQIIKSESNCTAALASATAVVGYSEGGYAAVALAEGLDKMGVDIIKVEAGAGPYRMATAVILKSTENADLGTFPSSVRHYYALMAAAYSSTYPELPNFEQGQDMLNSQSRATIVELVTNSSSEQAIQAVIPIGDPLSIFSSEFVSLMREAVADGDTDPCSNPDRVVEGINDKLCDALKENDLTLILETTPYPVRLCHSPNDEIVDITNLPNFDGNVLLEFLESSGTHVEAAIPCVLQAMLFMLSSDFQDYQVEAKDTSAGCLALLEPTSLAPSTDETMMPSIESTFEDETSEPTSEPIFGDKTSEPTPEPIFEDKTSEPTLETIFEDETSEPSSEPAMSNAHHTVHASVVLGSALVGMMAALV